MLINFNHLKTFYNALVHKMKSLRGNWEQNDPSADDYIKNRTHWVDNDGTVHKLDKKFVDMPEGIVTEESLFPILEDNLAPVTFTNDYDSLSGKPAVVQYITQDLTDDQKAMARNNIDVYSKNETYSESDKIGYFYLTYTGAVGGKSILSSSNGRGYYKVSDMTPRFEDIISFTSIDSEGVQNGIFGKGVNCYQLGGTLVVTKVGKGSTIGGLSFIAEETGIYFNNTGGSSPVYTNILECTYKQYEIPSNIIDVTRTVNGVEPNIFGETHLSFKDLQYGMLQQPSLPDGYPFIKYIAEEEPIASDTCVCVNEGDKYVFRLPESMNLTSVRFDPEPVTVGNNKWILRATNTSDNTKKDILFRDFKETQYSSPELITEDGVILAHYDSLNGKYQIDANAFGSIMGDGTFNIEFFDTTKTYTMIDEAYIPDSIARTSDVNELKENGGVGYTEGETIHTIDPKYLPSGVGFTTVTISTMISEEVNDTKLTAEESANLQAVFDAKKPFFVVFEATDVGAIGAFPICVYDDDGMVVYCNLQDTQFAIQLERCDNSEGEWYWQATLLII